MPLHGKIVVIKRTGGDGTEFPLTATCVFGRKPDCDIRIQLPQVSKEHCRIDLNENKEIILTNLSSVNPTRVNGEPLDQPDRLKHGDVITIIDRSFRFESAPAPTPKKRLSSGRKSETLKVLKDQQAGDCVTAETGEKGISEVSTDPHLKDGANHENIQRTLEKTMEMEDDSLDVYGLPEVNVSLKGFPGNVTKMPLHGKIVVIKRTGGDGKEFPLTATCIFGRKPDCDICIQIPQVSKEHCRIDLNENKEIILTNLSSVNPTRVNGEPLDQPDRLKHGDVITIIDRSFRFESAPAPTPKKRLSSGRKSETLKVLKDQQAGDCVTAETGEKDGANHENIQRTLEKTMEMEDDSLLQSKTNSPFGDLYQMIKRSLDVKTPRKSCASVLQTPTSRFCTPKPVGRPVFATEDKSTPKKVEADVSPAADVTKVEAEKTSGGTPKSVKKQRKSIQVPSTEMAAPKVEETETAPTSEATSPQKRIRTTPERFTAGEVIESPKRRRSKEATPTKPAVTEEKEGQAVTSPKTQRASPRNSVKETSKKRKSGEMVSDLPTPQIKRKRVSFGGHLNPELFDKRLPPDSPLRKGAAPRRSLGQAASKQSLLRRASVIGVRQEFEDDGSKKKSPAKGRTPSPKKTTGSKNASPKTPTPTKKSPKSKSPSPKSKTPSPAKGGSPSVQTPSVQGRFSVSRINTPSPVADDDDFDQVPLFTPKLPLKRKNIQTPNLVKSAAKVMRRRSGISRASMKVTNTWAGIVKFGQTKAPVAAPAKQTVIKKTTKKAVAKPQTPARELPGHVSTGHADSPVTIVVGRAHRQNVTLPTGAAPRLITNTVVLQKNMKMDEDLTGVCEIFKTPVNERNRRCFINEISAMKTPVGDLGMSVVEPSVLNTPEETGEMMVSPLSISSTVKDGRYNSEAVQRLLDDDQESSFVVDSPAMETLPEDVCEQQCADLKTTSVTTPKQKTPRQKSEPIEDLRGKILKTPQQKPEHQECLTGVKRIMKTPRQKAQPIEDLRGKILKTPKQKAEHRECLTGVKDLMKTPQQEAEDLPGTLLETPTVLKAVDVSLDGVKEPVETTVQESENLCEKTDTITPIMETTAPVEDTVDVQELTEEPLSDPAGQLETNEVEDQTSADCDVIVAKELDFAQEESQVDVTPSDVIDVEMEKATETNEVVVDDDHSEEVSVGAVEAAVDENLPVEQPKVDAVEKNVSEDQPEAEVATCTEVETVATDLEQEVAVDQREATEHSEDPIVPDPQEMDPNEVIVVDHSEEVSVGAHESESSNAMETISQATVDENVPVEQPKVDTVEENVPEEQPEVEIATDHEKKPVRSRRAKVVEPEVAEDKEEAKEPSEDPAVPAPVRGRRGKKTEAVAPPAVKKTRGRNTKTTESNDVEPAEEKVALKPKRGRNAKKASDEAEMVQEVAFETETAPEPESEPSAPVEVHHESHDIAAPLEKAAPKPKRARKAKQAEESLPSEQDVPCIQSEDVPQADLAKEADANEAVEAVQQAPVVAEVEAVTKKPVRRGRAKVVESKAVEVKEEATEHSEDAVVPAPVRGRRGKKTEATAPPAAARQTKRGKNAKSEESTSEGQAEIVPEKAVETTPVTEETPEDIAPPAEEAVVKPVRGRKTKQTPEPVPQPEENDLAEEVVTVETKQQSQPSVRARRGRNAKQEEEKDAETIEPQEPVKKTRRTRKAEPDHVEAREEVRTVEIVTEEAEAPLVVEPVEVIELVTVAAKPKRGGRKAKQDPGSETPVQSTEVQEVPAVSATEKPKRGGRGKRVIEEVVVVVEEEPNHELEAVAEEDAPVVKNSRARGAKTSVKKEVPQATPAKRARRGAALPIEETKAESTAQVSESASVEPAKKGRRAAAAKPTANDATVTSDKAKPDADVEDAKVSKRAVRWRSGVEVFDIPKVTPAKAVRGKKSKLVDQADAESKKVSEDANKTGEMELSAEVVEVQPPKRARRGAKVPEVKADKAESTSMVVSVEAETQPKSRKGRSAKK